jgi:uncharacterized protein (DUF2062 family)
MICTAWASGAAMLCAHAAEQETEQISRAARVLSVMDVLQTVCIVIVIAAAVLVLGFYLLKMIFARTPASSETKEKNDEEE